MKNPYEEDVARYLEAIRAAGSLLESLAAKAPRPPSPQSRRLRKVTPAVIRRSIAGLRSGEMRPIDPSKDPNTLADQLEAGLKLMAEMERAMATFDEMVNSLTSMVAHTAEKALAEAMAVYHEARELARTSGNETLKEHVRRMDRAIGRGARR
jgi:hypothetical protein